MKSPNSEITETGRRKGRNKQNVGFRVKMDYLFIYFVFENEKQIESFFSLHKNCLKSKKTNQISSRDHLKFYATGFESLEVWNFDCLNTSVRMYFTGQQCS